MTSIGITGGIGSGKSVVSMLMKVMGIPVYEADAESKKLLNTSAELREALKDAFGENLYEGTQINRPLFAAIIFNDPAKLQLANSLIHPQVRKNFAAWLDARKAEGHSIAAAEVAILFESGFRQFVDKSILVYAPLECRLERAMKRDSTSREQITARIKNQLPDEEKMPLADFVIYNDGTRSVVGQVEEILRELI